MSNLPHQWGKTLENNYLPNFHRQGGMQPPKNIIHINLDFKKGREIKHSVAPQMQNFLRQGGVQSLKFICI